MIFDENKIIAQAYMSMLGEKKMDPVGKEDGDIDNDGDKDKSDAYLHARRKAISTSIKKEGIDIEMPKKSSMGKDLEKDEDEMDDDDNDRTMKVKNKKQDNDGMKEASCGTKKMKEDADQVNELSNDTLTRYSNSARGQARHSMVKLGGAKTSGEVDKLSSTMTKRLKGNAAASRKMKEDVDQIDELSTNKLLSYRAKATEKLGSDPSKDAKRKAGIGASGQKVKDRLTANDDVNRVNMSRAKQLARQGMKNQMKEDHNLEITDYQADALIEAAGLQEISKKTLGSYVKKAAHDAVIQRKIGADFENRANKARKPIMKSSAEKLGKDYTAKSRKRRAGINTAVDRLTKEEVDQIDELSKGTLGSYVKKAAFDSAMKGVKLGGETDRKMYKPTQDAVLKRQRGIGKAVSRLTKEDIDQLDELSGDTVASYHYKAGRDVAKRGGYSASGPATDADKQKVSARRAGMNRAMPRVMRSIRKEDYNWNWDAILEAPEEEINAFIEQLDNDELESFISEFDSIEEGSYQSSTGSRQPMNANGQETLEPRAEADKAFAAAHKRTINVKDHPYGANQHAPQKPQAPKRTGDERNSEPKKTLSDIRKR